MIIEKVTESDLQTELKIRIGDPLHLNNTYFEWTMDIHNRVANPWYDYYQNGTLINIIDLYKTSCWSAVWAHGNIISTAEDIAIWAKSLFEAKVISQESLNQMLTFVPGSYLGLGVQKISLSGRELWGHGGALGYQTIVAYSPVDSVSIAILANDEAMPVLNTMEELFKHVLASKYPLITFDTKSINLGEIPDNSQPIDTTFYVFNKGGGTDSIFVSIDCGNADSNALYVEPSHFELAPGDSQAITYKIIPHPFLESKLYVTKLKIDSKFSPTTPSFSKQIIFNIIYTVVEENETDLSKSFVLKQNYPNPFNPTTMIKYSLAKDSHVRLVVYNILGEVVTLLVDEFQSQGSYNVMWDAHNQPTGLYIYRLEVEGFSATRKMFLQK